MADISNAPSEQGLHNGYDSARSDQNWNDQLASSNSDQHPDVPDLLNQDMDHANSASLEQNLDNQDPTKMDQDQNHLDPVPSDKLHEYESAPSDQGPYDLLDQDPKDHNSTPLNTEFGDHGPAPSGQSMNDQGPAEADKCMGESPNSSESDPREQALQDPIVLDKDQNNPGPLPSEQSLNDEEPVQLDQGLTDHSLAPSDLVMDGQDRAPMEANSHAIDDQSTSHISPVGNETEKLADGSHLILPGVDIGYAKLDWPPMGVKEDSIFSRIHHNTNNSGCAEDKLAAVGSCLVTENEDNNVVVDGTKIEKMSDESQISIDEISDSASHANKEFCTGPPSSDAHTLEDTTVGNFTIELSQNGDDESKDSALLVPKETNPAAEITGDTAGISPHNSPQSTCIKSCLVGSDKPAERSPMNVSFSTPLICYHEYPVSQCTQSTQDINEVLANTENLSLYDDTETNVMDSAGCYGPPSETAMGLLLSAKIEDVSNEEDDTPPTTEVLESQSISQEVITKETVRLCDVASNSELHTTSDSQEQATNCVEIIIEDLISHTFASREKASHGVKVVVGDIHHTNKYTDEQVPGNLEPISDGCLSQDNVSCIKDEREISDKGKLGYGIAEQLQLEEHERSGDIDKEGQCLCLNGTNDVVQSMIEPDIHTEELNHVSQIRQDTDSNGERRIPLSRDMNAKETIAPLSEVCIHGELEKDVEHNVTEITCNLKSYPEKVLSDDNSNTESTINTIPDSNETSPCNIDDDSNSPPANTTKTTFGLKSIDKDQNKSIFESVGDEETCHDIDSNSVEYIQSIGDTTSEGLKTEHFNEPTVSETPQTMCHDLSPDIQSSSSSVTANETAKGGNSSQTVCDQKLSAEVNSDQTASSSPDEKSTRIDAEHENQRDNEESVSYKEPDVMINTDDIESNIFKIDNTGPCVESVYTPVLTGVHLEIVKEKYKEIEAERIRVTNKYQVENPIPMEEDTEQETGRYDSQSNSSDRLVIALGEPGQTDICGTEIPDANDSSDTTNVNLDTNASHDNMAHVNNENLNKDESNCEPGREMNSLSIVQRPVKEDALCTTDKSSEDKECVIRKLNRIEMSSMDMLEEEDTKSCSMEASDKEDDNDIRSESLDILVLPDVDVNAIIKTENMPCVESIKRCLHTFRDCNGQGDNHEVPDISLESYPISQTDLTVEYHNPQYKVDPFSTSPLTKEESLSQLLTPSECKPQQTSDQRSSQTSQSSSTNSFVTAKEVYICSQNSSQGSQIPNAEVGDNQEDEDVSYSSKTCSQISSQPSSQSDEECCSGGNEDTSSSPMLSESNEDDVTETITQGPVDSPKSLKRRHESSDMVTCDASPPKRRHGVSEEIEKGMDITCQQHETGDEPETLSPQVMIEDQTVPGGSVVPSDSKDNSEMPLYSCDADLYDGTDKPLCMDVKEYHGSQERNEKILPESPESDPLPEDYENPNRNFTWKNSLSSRGRSVPIANNETSNTGYPEELPALVPLNTCRKPLRLGLSRRQRVKRLHPYHGVDDPEQ